MERLAIKLTIIIVLLIVCIFFGIPSFAQEKAYDCDAGIKRCKKLEGDKKKHKRCLYLVCSKAEKDKKAETKTDKGSGGDTPAGQVITVTEDGKETCELGLRKCNPLRTENKYYWACMKDTCLNKDSFNASCEMGHEECKPQIDEYWGCINTICKNPEGTYEACETGQEKCGRVLRNYWDCVYEICLGDPYEYRDPSRYIGDEDDDDGEPKPPPIPALEGVPDKFKYAPEGVDQQQWISIPRYKATPGDVGHMRCLNRNVSINCSGSGLGNCICSDGTMPFPVLLPLFNLGGSGN